VGESNQEWSWVGEDGTEHDLDESELTFSLSSEELPAHVLVTKHGWGEWLPAMQVAELQWALPAGRSDNPRKPSAGRKPPPPLERYPALKQRAKDIASGAIDPTAESSLAMPVVQLPPRPAPGSSNTAASPSSPAPPLPAAPSHTSQAHHYRPFSMADADEPTLQIDADSLDAALGLGQERGPRTGLPAVAAVPRATLQSNDMVAPLVGRLGSKPDHVAPPPDPGSSPLTGSVPPPAARLGSSPYAAPSLRATGPQPGVAPAVPHLGLSQRLHSSAPPPPLVAHSPSAGDSPLPMRPSSLGSNPPLGAAAEPGSSSGTSSPSFAPVQPRREHGTGKWLWVTIAAGLISATAIALWLSNRRVEPQITAPIPTPIAPSVKVPTPTTCKAAVSALPVAGWMYPSVRPIIARAPGANSLLVGYAQTSRIASGLIIDTATLNSQKPFTTQGNSPLLSVAPVTQALGQRASFLESRAASTLQSAVFISAKRPFALGLNHDGLAIRREGELQDTVVWKPQWETVSVPLTARLEERSHAIVVRGGGERGAILVGRISDDAEPLGELQEMVVDAPRLGTPSLNVSSGRVLIAVDGATRENVRKLFLASAEAPRVPAVSEVLPINDDNPTTPSALALRDGTTLVAYARGQTGSQTVAVRLLDRRRGLLGPVLEISPAGKDAFGPELALDGDRVVVLFVVRQNNNSELWAAAVDCIPGDG
jgi:hypothetical protein